MLSKTTWQDLIPATRKTISLDIGWAQFLARDLAAWAGVWVREFRDDIISAEYWPSRSIVKKDHYILNECEREGEIKLGTYRVMSDVNGEIECYNALDFKTAKGYADDVASEDHLNISIVFDTKFNALYLGKHY